MKSQLTLRSRGAAFWQPLQVISVLFTGTMLTALLTFIAQVVLARLLPIADFGRIAALLAAVNFFTPIATAGINWFILQVYGRELSAASRWLRPCAILLAISCGLSCACLAGYVLYSDLASRLGVKIVLLASISILLGQVLVEVASARFQLEDRFNALTLWQMTTQVGRFLVVLATLLWPHAVVVLAGYGIIGLLTTISGIRLLWPPWASRLRIARDSPEATEVPSLRQTIVQASPFALVTAFYILYFQGGVVVLDWLAGGAAAATFNAAFLIISAVNLIPNVIYPKFLVPKFYRWGEHDRATFAAAFHVGVPLMMLLGSLLWMMIAINPSLLIATLFGNKYAGASNVLLLLSASLPIRFMQVPYSVLFISRNEVWLKTTFLGLGTLTSLAISFALIPSLGVVGAAIANVAAEFVVLVAHVYGTARYIAGIGVGVTFRPSTFLSCLRHLLNHAPEGMANTW